MRILVLSNMYPPHAYGGYEQSCGDVVERWLGAGHEVLVLTSGIRVPGVADPPLGERDKVWRDLRIFWEDHVILNPPLWRRATIQRANERSLERALSEFRPDVVSAWAMGAMSMGLLTVLATRAVPVVLVVCDEWPVYGPVVDPWLRPLAGRPHLARALRRVTGLATSQPPLDKVGPACFVSGFLRQAVRERSPWGFEDSTIVYSGIAAEEFEFSPVRGPWRWRLAYVGRIDPRKGIATVVRALAELPQEAALTIVGRGDARYLLELRQLARTLGVEDRVSFTSSDRTKLGHHYWEVDVVVFPPVWEEPFGLVPLEAMACGTPVVATLVGGASEFLVDGGNCLAFPPGGVNELVTVLHRLAGDAGLRAQLVEGGRRVAEELSVDRLALELERWHRSAAEGTGRPLPRRKIAR